MISHHLTKIYQTQILNESLYDDDLIDALYAAAGKSKWLVQHRTSVLKPLFSDDEGVLDMKHISSTNMEAAWKFALKEHKNLTAATRIYVLEQGIPGFLYSSAGLLSQYILARKTFDEKDAPVAFEFLHSLINYLKQKAGPNFVTITDDSSCKDAVDVMQMVLRSYIKAFCEHNRSLQVDNILNNVLEDFTESLYDDGRYIDDADLINVLDATFGETIYYYVAKMHSRWPEFEKFLEVTSQKAIKLRYNLNYAKLSYNKKINKH